MLKNKFKKILATTLAVTGVFACTASLTACETSNPKVEMQIEFNDETYDLEYTLYRKTAPATVKHFLALAENGYFDGLCVHDYTGEKMYTGGYKYEDNNLVYQKYYDIVKDYQNFPCSVWLDEEKANPTYTLYGEFYGNSEFKVESGAKKQEFGSLTMFYEDIDSDDRIIVERHNGEGIARYAYEDNSATSLFFISLADEAKSDSNYCTFATLNEKSVDKLKELRTAIEEYIESNYNDEDDAEFAPDTKIVVEENDPVLGEVEQEYEYSVPPSAIVIKKVEVKKF